MDVEIEGAVLEQRNKHAEVRRIHRCQNCIIAACLVVNRLCVLCCILCWQDDNENLGIAFVAGLASGCAGIMVGQV
jgi:hypothetical protein